MVATGHIRIARYKYVSGRNLLEVSQYCRDDHAAAAGMDRNAVSLTDQPAAPVGDEAREIVTLCEDRAASGLKHHLAHSLGDVVDALLNHGQGDGIKISAHCRAQSDNC